MRMNPNEFGKKLGIGVRVAGRIAQQRAEEAARRKAQTETENAGRAVGMPAHQQPSRPIPAPNYKEPDYKEKAREIGKNSHKLTRAAGRGLGGFLRPFGRVGGILWLEVTGFFFGLFGLYFAQDIFRTRLSWIAGPQHSRFLMAVALTAIFGYLSVSAFWRARRK
jgi:hypothetical protein